MGNLPVPDTPKILVPAKVFRTVAENLKTDPKTRGRLVIVASTGVRPAEVKRTEPANVDLERRVWMVRTAKGGTPRAIWLNDEMLAAWQAFVAAGAWGTFDASDYAKALYAAGWPKDVRPYQARHSVALELGERGTDLSRRLRAVRASRLPATTQQHYQGILASRMKGASDTLAGRFSGWQAPEPEPGTDLAALPS